MLAVEHRGYTVFFLEDPRPGGFTGHVLENVTLTNSKDDPNAWPIGTDAPSLILGVRGNEFVNFSSARELANSGFSRCLPLAGPYQNLRQYKIQGLGLRPEETMPQ